MKSHHIMSLADKMATAFEAKGIPNGDLYRSITHDAWVHARATLMEAIESQAAEIADLKRIRVAVIAERDALATNLLAAERTLRDRAHPAREPRDPPECLRTLGFWPDCGCGECYAIHCLDNAMAERDALQARLNALSEQSLLKLVADLRWALGDNGKRMQPDLIEYAKALRADAERYRWLRDKPTWSVDVEFRGRPEIMKWSVEFHSYYGSTEHDDNLDAAIDAARAQESA